MNIKYIYVCSKYINTNIIYIYIYICVCVCVCAHVKLNLIDVASSFLLCSIIFHALRWLNSKFIIFKVLFQVNPSNQIPPSIGALMLQALADFYISASLFSRAIAIHFNYTVRLSTELRCVRATRARTNKCVTQYNFVYRLFIPT